MLLVLTSVAATATQSRDGRDEICHRDGCKKDHPEEYFQYIHLISFEALTSLREENQSQVNVTIENECNTDRSKFNTFEWVDLVLTSVNGKTTIIDESKRIFSVGRGSGNRRTVTWTIEGREPGNDTLFVDIHARNSHENTHKYTSGTHDITITPIPPNIIMSSLQTVPTEPVEGDLINITTDVINIGNPASWNITFFMKNQTEDMRAVDLARDESMELLWSWNSSGNLGDWTVRIKATGVDDEEHLEDNALETNFYVMTRPDIDVLNVSYDPSEPVDGEVVTLVAALWNNGESSTSFVIDLYLDNLGDRVGYENVTMQGFEYTNITFYWVPTKQAGEHFLIIRVDPHDEVNETNEDNNYRDRNITVVPPPIQSDPSIHHSDIHLPDIILEGDNITITIAVRNLGNSSINLTARLLMSGSTLLTLTHFYFHLEPHEVLEMGTYWDTSLRTGNWSVHVELFGTDPPDERKHNNNAFKEFMILDRPDPGIVSVNWTPFNPLYNSSILVNVTFMNYGGGEVNFLSTIAMGIEKFTHAHHLLPGENITITQVVTFLRPGNFTVVLQDITPWERIISNDHAEVEVEAFVSQDFRIDSFLYSQPTGYFRDRHRISALISNNWVLDGTGQLIIRQNGRQFATFNVTLPAGENQTYGMDWIPTIGEHSFSAFLIVPSEDPISADDHHKRLSISPDLPEISLTTVVLSPTILLSRDEVEVFTLVTNSGETGTNVTLSFMIDGILKSARKIYVPGNSQASHTFVWAASAGDHFIGIRITAIDDGMITSGPEVQRNVFVQEVTVEEDDDIQSQVFTLLLALTIFVSASFILLEIRKGVIR